MNRKPQGDEYSQARRFEEAVRELGVDLDEAKLKEALRKIAPEKPKKEKDDG